MAHSSLPSAPLPAPVRHDGITPERQRRFLEVLAATGSVQEAARQAGASRQAFYALRNRAASKRFSEAWNRAIGRAINILGDTAFERAIEGVEEPVFWKGEQVGTRRRYNDRLLMFLLRARDPIDFAPLPDLRGFHRRVGPPDTPFETLLGRIAPPGGDPFIDGAAPEPDSRSHVSTLSTSRGDA